MDHNQTPAATEWLHTNERSIDREAVLAKAQSIAHRDGRLVVCRNDLEAARVQCNAC